jgi:hypothetical protein
VIVVNCGVSVRANRRRSVDFSERGVLPAALAKEEALKAGFYGFLK